MRVHEACVRSQLLLYFLLLLRRLLLLQPLRVLVTCWAMSFTAAAGAHDEPEPGAEDGTSIVTACCANAAPSTVSIVISVW